MKILAIIPARSGSKSIKDKNIRSIDGKPLIAHTIEHAKQSKLINRIIVSTDNKYYSEIAKSYGAEVPFLRPKTISQDLSTDLEFFKHALSFLQKEENYLPDICVHLRPTYPIRNVRDIDEMVRILLQNDIADSIKSVQLNKNTSPYKMWTLGKNLYLKPIISNDKIKEPYNEPRQNLPKFYVQNASIDIIKTSTITEKNSLSGEVILGYEMKHNFDIDYYEDFDKANIYLSKKGVNKTYCVDIDGVIAHLSPNNNYQKAIPIKENIIKINKLYKKNKIIIFTARGSKTGIDWEKTTKEQLSKWGLKYHELYFGKPAADYYIDDRIININNI